MVIGKKIRKRRKRWMEEGECIGERKDNKKKEGKANGRSKRLGLDGGMSW